MSERIKVLLVEDADYDAHLALRALRVAGIDVDSRRVQTESGLRRELRDFLPDVVLSDFSMPGFDGIAALAICRESSIDLPFIFMSGTVGEDVAVEAMKQGANDYVMKGSLARLAPAVMRELREAAQRKRDRAELQRFRLALDQSVDMILITDRTTMRHVDVNQTACTLLGYSREELLNIGPAEVLPVSRAELEKAYDEMIADPSHASGMRSYYRCRDGSHLPFESTRRVLRSGNTWLITAISRDIRERIAAEKALRETEAGLRRAQVMAKLASVVTASDGSFESWSETLPQLVGMTADRIPHSTRDWLELLHPEDRPALRAKAIETAVTRKRGKINYRLRRADGEWISVRHTMEPLRGGDETWAGRWFTTIQDVTELREAEAKIGHLNRVYAVLSGINTLIVRVRDRDELFREACKIAVEAGGFRLAWIGVVDRAANRVKPIAWHGTGVGEDYFASMPLALDGPGLAGKAALEGKEIVSDDMAVDPRIQLREEAAAIGLHGLAILPLMVAGEAAGVLSLYAGERGFFDADEMKLLRELAGDLAFALDHLGKAKQLNYLAYYDVLTGLANRNHAHERLSNFIDLAQRSGSKVAVLMLDIDRFRTVNDSLGRESGDELLRQVAQRMRQAATDPESIARLGADRFVMVRYDVAAESDVARHNDRKLDECFATPFNVNGTELRIAAKVGIALYPADGADADALFRNAEAALKKAKATGERTLFYAQEMTERVAEKLTLENKLRQALEREEFVLHYQPKVDIESRRVQGVEALIRWRSGDGLVPPAKFIPLLEETGLIREVGAWALRRAVLDHRHWLRLGIGAPRVAVNVSAYQLRQQDFVDTLREVIDQGANPTGLDLEITESLLMKDLEGNIRKLKAVRDMGVSIAIDDFGTGYSSLGYLARLPVQMLKIDRSFVVAMLQDPTATTLVQTIISLAHSLRLKVVAEGVETEEQATMLRLLRCNEMQGYLFSRPVPWDEMSAMLRSSPGRKDQGKP